VFCFGVGAAAIVSSAVDSVASTSEGGANCFPSFRFLRFPDVVAIDRDVTMDCGFDEALFDRVDMNLAGAVKASAIDNSDRIAATAFMVLG
jgi:hypothetical protein